MTKHLDANHGESIDPTANSRHGIQKIGRFSVGLCPRRSELDLTEPSFYVWDKILSIKAYPWLEEKKQCSGI